MPDLTGETTLADVREILRTHGADLLTFQLERDSSYCCVVRVNPAAPRWLDAVAPTPWEALTLALRKSVSLPREKDAG